MERAKETQSSLPPELPSFIKVFPKGFCNLHLSKQDSAIFLEDEDGKAYETKFLSEKVGLSACRRGFSIAHGLREGDAPVFQLVKPCHWKVFISRVDNLSEVDGALSLLQLFSSCNEPKKRKHGQIGGKSSLEMSHENHMVEETPPEKDGPDDVDLASEVLDEIRLCEFVVRFEYVKQPEDFVVAVDGIVIGGELSSHLRNKYYELCISQSHFLHNNLIKGLNCKLVFGIISETEHRGHHQSLQGYHLCRGFCAVWEKMLRAFQDLGMDAGFLLTRLGRLKNLSVVWKSMGTKKMMKGWLRTWLALS